MQQAAAWRRAECGGQRPWVWRCGCCSASGWAWRPPRARSRSSSWPRPQVSELRVLHARAPREAWSRPARRRRLAIGCNACALRTLPRHVAGDSGVRGAWPLSEPSPVRGSSRGWLCLPLTVLLLPAHTPLLLCLAYPFVTSKPPFSPAWAGRLAVGSGCPTSNCAWPVTWRLLQQL